MFWICGPNSIDNTVVLQLLLSRACTVPSPSLLPRCCLLLSFASGNYGKNRGLELNVVFGTNLVALSVLQKLSYGENQQSHLPSFSLKDALRREGRSAPSSPSSSPDAQAGKHHRLESSWLCARTALQ